MNQLSLIGIRLLAIYMILTGINAVVTIGATIQIMDSDIDNKYIAMQLSGMFIPAIIGIILWMFSSKLAKYVSAYEADEVTQPNDQNLVSAGTFLIGAYIVANTLPSLYMATSQYKALEYGMESSTIVQSIKLHIIELLLGFLLIVGHRFLVRAYTWFRAAGSNA